MQLRDRGLALGTLLGRRDLDVVERDEAREHGLRQDAVLGLAGLRVGRRVRNERVQTAANVGLDRRHDLLDLLAGRNGRRRGRLRLLAHGEQLAAALQAVALERRAHVLELRLARLQFVQLQARRGHLQRLRELRAELLQRDLVVRVVVLLAEDDAVLLAVEVHKHLLRPRLTEQVSHGPVLVVYK